MYRFSIDIQIMNKSAKGIRMKFWQVVISITVLIVTTNVNAALVGRLAVTDGGTDYQAYYDTEAELTWLADGNSAGTTMNWADANNWAAGLSVGGINGWRLADTLQPDSNCSFQSGFDLSDGYNCTGSEMGNLFYNVLGNTAGSLSNTGPFNNIRSGGYWSATELGFSTSSAFIFNMSNGGLFYGNKSVDDSINAWAVQSGDVSAVPVPAAVWLFGSGLIGLVGFAKLG